MGIYYFFLILDSYFTTIFHYAYLLHFKLLFLFLPKHNINQHLKSLFIKFNTFFFRNIWSVSKIAVILHSKSHGSLTE